MARFIVANKHFSYADVNLVVECAAIILRKTPFQCTGPLYIVTLAFAVYI